jgi:NAD+ kinase
MKVLLVVNPETSRVVASEIEAVLHSRNIETYTFSYLDGVLPHTDFDIAFSLGGDGTVLFTARTVPNIPILPVNLGTLGFISAVMPNEWVTVFDAWLKNDVPLSYRIMLNVRVKRNDEIVFDEAALNDAVVSSSGIAKTIRLEASSAENHLGYYRSDGLIISTPTGSTAYNTSAGGPILDPEMEALILNPICPFTFLHRPIVTPANDLITVKIDPLQRSPVLLTIDGQLTFPLERSDEILLSCAKHKAVFVACSRSVFYKTLKSKLGWGYTIA